MANRYNPIGSRNFGDLESLKGLLNCLDLKQAFCLLKAAGSQPYALLKLVAERHDVFCKTAIIVASDSPKDPVRLPLQRETFNDIPDLDKFDALVFSNQIAGDEKQSLELCIRAHASFLSWLTNCSNR